MKNSEKALLFIKYWKEVNDNNFIIDINKFCKDNNLTIEVLYKHIFSAFSVCEKIYLDYVNNFLTVKKFSEYYGYSIDEGTLLIESFRKLNKK